MLYNSFFIANYYMKENREILHSTKTHSCHGGKMKRMALLHTCSIEHINFRLSSCFFFFLFFIFGSIFIWIQTGLHGNCYWLKDNLKFNALGQYVKKRSLLLKIMAEILWENCLVISIDWVMVKLLVSVSAYWNTAEQFILEFI